jgi:hypothetical protein
MRGKDALHTVLRSIYVLYCALYCTRTKLVDKERNWEIESLKDWKLERRAGFLGILSL